MTIVTVFEVLDTLAGKGGQVDVLCGAGISVRSGIPAAWPLLEHIVLTLGCDSPDIARMRRSDGSWRMPFEAFMEAFIEYDKSTTLFDIFLLGEPNRNHHLLKVLAVAGVLSAIYTTNFDLLIERAFAASPAAPLDVILETDAVPRSFDRTATRLVKLHGTASEPASVRSTLLSISSGSGLELRAGLIREAMQSPSSAIWVWGYSCSDVLDINPAIVSSPPAGKAVVLLSHDPGVSSLADSTISPLGTLPEGNPFRGCNGLVVTTNSDLVVDELLGEAVPIGAKPLSEVEWQAVVERWIASSVEPHVAMSILCHIYYNLAEFDLALKYNEAAIRKNGGKDQRGVGAALSNRGMILFGLGRHSEALEAFSGALGASESIDFRLGVATSHNNIGYVSAQIGRIAEGQRHIDRGLDVVAHGGFREARVCEGYLLKSRGELCVLQGNLEAAALAYESASAIFADGHLPELAEVMMLQGKLQRMTGNTAKGDELIGESLVLGMKVGAAEVVREARRLLG